MDRIIDDKNESFDMEFYEYLEYHLTRTLKKSKDDKLNKMWCDGIQPPNSGQLDKRNITRKGQIETRAWIGSDGQTEFKLTIKIGEYSLKRLLQSDSLIECVPSDNSTNWLTIDFEIKHIELRFP
jgi:hypothetical protein